MTSRRRQAPPRFVASDWEDDAACATEDPEVFFPDHSSGPVPKTFAAAAKAVCARCTVRAQCLALALSFDRNPSGVWAGTTPSERSEMHPGNWAGWAS